MGLGLAFIRNRSKGSLSDIKGGIRFKNIEKSIRLFRTKLTQCIDNKRAFKKVIQHRRSKRWNFPKELKIWICNMTGIASVVKAHMLLVLDLDELGGSGVRDFGPAGLCIFYP